MTQADSQRLFDALSYTFALNDAQIIATLGYDGGGLIETVPKLECFEGRLQSYEVTEDGEEIHQLEYHFSFEVAGVGPPEVGQSSRGRIVVIGKDGTGKRMEIRGDGWVGYDGDGNVEGRFDTPPIIIIEDPDDDGEDDGEAELPPPSNVLDFPMPENYQSAIVRVEAQGDDWEE